MNKIKSLLREIIVGIIIAVIAGIILQNLQPIKEWIENKIGYIIYFLICFTIGIFIGLVIILIANIFSKIRDWIANKNRNFIIDIIKLETKELENYKTELEKLKQGQNKLSKPLAITNLTLSLLYFEKNDLLAHSTYLGIYFSILFSNELSFDSDMLGDIEIMSVLIDDYIERKDIIIPENFLVSLETLLRESKNMRKEIHYNKLNEIFEKLYKHYGKDYIKEIIKKRQDEIKEGF